MKVRHAVACVLAFILIGSCAEAGSDSEPPSATGQPMSERELRNTVTYMQSQVRQAGTAGYDELIRTDLAGEEIERSVGAEWGARPNRWEMTLKINGSEAVLGEDAESGITLVFRVVDGAMYLTAPEWEDDLAGKWMVFTPKMVTESTGIQMPTASLKVPPYSIAALMTFEATAGTQTPEGTRLIGSVHPTILIQLAGISRNALADVPKPATLVPDREVILTLDSDGLPEQLILEPEPDAPEFDASSGADIAAILPTWIKRADTVVTFDHFGRPVDIEAPPASKLTEGS